MRELRLALLAALVGCARQPVWPPPPDAWKQVDSSPCGFVVWLPGTPKVREWTDRKGIRVVEYTVTSRYLYMAERASADQTRHGDSAEAFVRERLQFEKDAVERQHWPIREATVVPLGKCPGYRLVSLNQDGLEIATRFVWAGDRAFVLGSAGPSGNPATATVTATLFGSLVSKLCE